MKRSLVVVLLLLVGLSAGVVSAQEPAPVATTAVGESDPSDEIVLYITEMTQIVRDNLDKPEEAKKLLTAYIDKHGKAMKSAGDRFEAKLNKLPADEAESYKEGMQRKMEKALEDFLATMLEFAERHPDAAKELDELLQVK